MAHSDRMTNTAIDATEPGCWWTEEDKRRFRETLKVTVSGNRTHYFSPARGNIYGEDFAWSEPHAVIDATKDE